MRSMYFLTYRDLESGVIGCCEIHGPIIALPSPSELVNQNVPLPKGKKHWHDCPELHKAAEGAAFIADYIKKEEEEKKVSYLINYRSRKSYFNRCLFLDQRRLEICGDGVGQVVLVDIYIGRNHGISGDNSAGSHSVR